MESPIWWSYEVHADKHEIEFLPNGDYILGTDGGLYHYDIQNEIWNDIENIPTTQFYRVAYNPHRPDWFYGGAQDNGTSGGNAQDMEFWERILEGMAFYLFFILQIRRSIGCFIKMGHSTKPRMVDFLMTDLRKASMEIKIGTCHI